MRSTTFFRFLYWCIGLNGIVLRWLYTFYFEPFLHWDEAPQALLARQIAEGTLFPFVHLQLPYIGAVEQYGLAVFFLVFGDGVFTVNLFYFLISALSLLFAADLYWRMLDRRLACIALAFFALSPPLVILFSLQSYSFGSLILCEAVILWAILPRQEWLRKNFQIAIMGAICGISLYNNILFSWCFLFCLWNIAMSGQRSRFAVFIFSFLLAYSPMLVFNLQNDFLSYQFIIAKFLGITESSVAELGAIGAVYSGVLDKLLGRGQEADLLMLYYLPNLSSYPFARAIAKLAWSVFIALSLLAFLSLHPKISSCSRGFSIEQISLRRVFYVCVLLACLASISQVRYLTVLVPMMPLVLVDSLLLIWKKSRIGALGISAIILTFLWGSHFWVFSVDAEKVDNEVGQVYSILQQNDLEYGYGSYEFQSYTAFHSRGEIKISPQIGPIFMDKIPHYSQIVDREDAVFFILPKNTSYLDKLREAGVKYKNAETQNWRVVWGLDRRLDPKDLIPEEMLNQPGGYKRWSYRENPAVLHVFRGGH